MDALRLEVKLEKTLEIPGRLDALLDLLRVGGRGTGGIRQRQTKDLEYT